jgi:ABC-type glycerol-3-phosphate transport system substrate-binding protein
MLKVTRRDLLRFGSIMAGGVLAGCAPKVVEVTREVEKVVEKEKVVKETVEVEKVVEQTVVVDTAAEKAASLKGKIIWDTFRTPGTGWNEERCASFMDRYPNTEVEFRPVVAGGQQDSYAKMYAQFAAGDLGDVCAFDPSHFHFWRAIDKKIIIPIDDLIAAENLDLSQWFPQFIEMQRYKGSLWGLPSWGWAGYDCMVINSKVWEAAGETVPDPKGYDTSMDQITEWARKFHKEGDQWGIGLGFAENHVAVIARIWGGDLINEDGTKCLLLEDGSVEAMKWCYQLAVEEQLVPSGQDLNPGGPAALSAGKLVMLHSGSLDVLNAKKGILDPEQVAISQILFPKRPDGKIPSQLRGGTWNICSLSKNVPVAWEFIKHITSTEGCASFNLVSNNFGLVRPDVIPVLKAKDPTYDWFEANVMNGMNICAPANSRGREYTDAVLQYGTKLMDKYNPMPFEQGLQEWNDAIQKVLDMDPA